MAATTGVAGSGAAWKRLLVLVAVGLSLGGASAVVISHHMREQAAGRPVSWLPWEE